jgi:Transposase IS116/IS110/IS902 family
VVAMTFKAAVDQPERFARPKAVGAHFGLTPKKYQSGEDRSDRPDRQGGRRHGAYGAVRGGQRDVDPRRAHLGAQGLGAARRRPARHEEGQGCARRQTGGGDGPHVVSSRVSTLPGRCRVHRRFRGQVPQLALEAEAPRCGSRSGRMRPARYAMRGRLLSSPAGTSLRPAEPGLSG